MGKIITFALVAYGIWFVYSNVDFAKVKDDTLDKLKNEKTIKTINSSRDSRQHDINNVLNND